MNYPIELETEHLKLRQWRDEDLPIYAKITSNPEVMKFFPAPLSREQSDAAAEKFRGLIASRGWGFWAIELKKRGVFIGYAGLHAPSTQFPFSPCVEIAWRVEPQYWESGVVLEAGEVILSYAFDVLKLDEVVYFTALQNSKAKGVMSQLGMRDRDKNFKHPSFPSGDSLAEHRLYGMTKEEWNLGG
jgi:RimJ/RimL family protein N-acetyltransferase